MMMTTQNYSELNWFMNLNLCTINVFRLFWLVFRFYKCFQAFFSSSSFLGETKDDWDCGKIGIISRELSDDGTFLDDTLANGDGSGVEVE